MSLHSQTSLRTWTLGAHSMGRSPRRSRSRVTELLRPQSQARRPGLPSTSGRSSQKHQKQRNNSAQSPPRHFVDQPNQIPPHPPNPPPPAPPKRWKKPHATRSQHGTKTPTPSSGPKPPPRSSNS